jgi:hypothetical protein
MEDRKLQSLRARLTGRKQALLDVDMGTLWDDKEAYAKMQKEFHIETLREVIEVLSPPKDSPEVVRSDG